MEFVTVVLALVVGLGCGATACWWVMSRRPSPADATVRAEMAAARNEAADARLETANARADAANARSEAAAARTEAAKADTEIERSRADVAQARSEAAAAREAAAHALAKVAGLEAMVTSADAVRDAAVARSAELAVDRESIVNQFKVLSSEALAQQGMTMDASAEQRLRATELLMTPVRETLERFESRLTEVEKERSSLAAELKQQVLGVQFTGEQLRRETASLVTALRKPQVRGAWGEMQLRRVVELAGMVEHCDFTEQATSATDDRVIRPDLKVTMAEQKYLYVDSKVPLAGFLDAQDADDPDARAQALSRFAKNVKGHVEGLGNKHYWKADESGATPEFVVMFLPSEAIFAEALALMPDLLEHAVTRGVILATPSSLIGLLRAISFGWKQAALAASAREISQLGRVLYDRLSTMGTHVDKLGRAIRTSVTAYNDAVGALESRVLVTARKFRDLQVSDTELSAPAQVEVTIRALTAPELVDDAARVEPLIGRGSKRALARGADSEAAWLQRSTPDVDDMALVDALGRPQGLSGLPGGAARG